jgi:hypothetical protein
MSNLVALDRNHHQHFHVNPTLCATHAAGLNLIPVVMSEFRQLVTDYPILLTKNGDTGEFTFVAMLGFLRGENLFWQNNDWQSIYIPLQLRRQPFFVGHLDDKSGEYPLCIDMDSPALMSGWLTDNDKPLYESTGAETAYLQEAKQCLAQLLQGEQHNKDSIDLLQELGLLQSLSLDIEFEHDEPTRLNGLYTIDETKLRALSDQQLLRLHHANSLEAVYLMLASLGQIYSLIAKKNIRSASKV